MGWRPRRSLRLLQARVRGSHPDHRRETATAPAASLRAIPGFVCRFFPGPVTEKVDLPGLCHLAMAMDSRQILVVDFSALRFSPALDRSFFVDPGRCQIGFAIVYPGDVVAGF